MLGGLLGLAYQALSRQMREMIEAPNLRYLLGCGSMFVLYDICLYLALGLAQDRSQVLEVGLMNYLWPMLTLLFSVPILRLRATVFLVPGVLLAMAGVLVATTQNQSLSWQSFQGHLAQNGVPYVLGAGGAAVWALYSATSRRWATDGQKGAVPLFMLASAAVLGLARLPFAEQTRWTVQAASELLFMGIGSSLAYIFWDRAMRQGDVVLVAAFSYLTPLLSTIVSRFYLGTAVGGKLWIGCVLVIAGAAICKWAVHDRPVAGSPVTSYSEEE